MRQTASGRGVRLMDNKRVSVLRFPTKKPSIPVWATVQLSPIWHIRTPCLALSAARDEASRDLGRRTVRDGGFSSFTSDRHFPFLHIDVTRSQKGRSAP